MEKFTRLGTRPKARRFFGIFLDKRIEYSSIINAIVSLSLSRTDDIFDVSSRSNLILLSAACLSKVIYNVSVFFLVV
jgi:hypothetical protein